MAQIKSDRASFAASVRVVSLLLTLTLCSLGTLALRAQARAHELFASAGEKMLTYVRAQHLEGERALMLNGMPLHVLSGNTRDEVPRLLDFMHARCRESGGQLGPQLARLEHRPTPAIALDRRLPLDGVLQRNDDRGGYVACLTLGPARVGPEDLLRRARAFLSTGDLSKVGDLRFVWARREGDITSYVAIYTEGPVPLLSMFPSTGDAPGIDLPGPPRPAHSRRILSTWQQDAAPMLVSYRVTGRVDEVEAAYRAQLAHAGYTLSTPRMGTQDAHTLLAQKGAANLLVVVYPRDPSATIISLTPLH
jgi:hypothetical protein